MPSPEFAYFMLHGRARWLMQEYEIREHQERLIKQRKGGRWAIMCDDTLDHEACVYKMLEFRKQHVHKNIIGPLLSMKIGTENGFVEVSKEEIDRDNNEWVASYRKLAHDAKRALGKSLIQLAIEQYAADDEAEYNRYY